MKYLELKGICKTAIETGLCKRMQFIGTRKLYRKRQMRASTKWARYV